LIGIHYKKFLLKGEGKMNDFLEFLAERRYMYYHYFAIGKPQAYTSMDCFDRIQKDARYDEVINLINYLPIEQQKIVNKRFDELRGL
jgi:hypothetical protein